MGDDGHELRWDVAGRLSSHFRLDKKHVVIREAFDTKDAIITDTQIHITGFETGLKLVRSFGHLLTRLHYNGTHHSVAERMRMASALSANCARTLTELELIEPTPLIVERHIHFPDLRSLFLAINSTRPIDVGFTFGKLRTFKARTNEFNEWPAQIVKANSPLEAVDIA